MAMRLLWHWLILVFGLYLITLITPISYDAPKDLLWAAAVLIFFNTILKPILILITLPLVILSLGLFLLVINAIILYLLPRFVHGFHVPGFFSAFFGALLLSLITTFFGRLDRRASAPHPRISSPARGAGKVIDI